MPELPEYKLFALWLTERLRGIEFDKLIKCRDYALTKDPNQPEVVEEFNKKCSKKLVSATARGKELALIFEDGSCLRVHLALGGYFVVKPLLAVKSYPFNEHVNFVLRSKDLNNCLFIVEAAQFPNFVTIAFSSSLQWDPTRSPDLVSEATTWTEHLERELAARPKAFDKSLFEVMHDQALFNGLGAYTINETLERLYLHYGVPPTTNALAFLSKQCNVKALRVFTSEFVRQILDYIGTDFDCSRYLEQEWLDFSNLFLLVFRKNKSGKNKVHCYTKGRNKCYTTCCFAVDDDNALSDQELSSKPGSGSDSDVPGDSPSKSLVTLPPGWQRSTTTKMTENSLNVGMYHWYSATARVKLHLADPTSVIMRTTAAKKELASKQTQLERQKRKADSDPNESPKKKLKEANAKPKKPIFVERCFDGVEWLAEDLGNEIESSTKSASEVHSVELDQRQENQADVGSMDPSTTVLQLSPSSSNNNSRINRIKRKRKKHFHKFCKIKQKLPVSI